MKVYELVRRSPPLDLNSRYAYFLLSDHFRKTGVVVESGGELVGFLGGFRPPDDPEVLFVWQMAVASSMRGRKLAKAMVMAMLARPESVDLRRIQATVGPSNAASRRVFESLATALDAPFVATPYLDAKAFGADGHDPEILLTVGPFTLPQSKEHTPR